MNGNLFPPVMYHNDVWMKFLEITKLAFNNSQVSDRNRNSLVVFKLSSQSYSTCQSSEKLIKMLLTFIFTFYLEILSFLLISTNGFSFWDGVFDFRQSTALDTCRFHPIFVLGVSESFVSLQKMPSFPGFLGNLKWSQPLKYLLKGATWHRKNKCSIVLKSELSYLGL